MKRCQQKAVMAVSKRCRVGTINHYPVISQLGRYRIYSSIYMFLDTPMDIVNKAQFDIILYLFRRVTKTYPSKVPTQAAIPVRQPPTALPVVANAGAGELGGINIAEIFGDFDRRDPLLWNTQPLCNRSGFYQGFNVSPFEHPSQVFVNECLGHQHCMTVSECSKRIDKHVTPGLVEWFIIALYSVILILGLVGNGLVCFVVVRTSHMRTVVNIFIVNLAVADFLVLLVCLPPSVLADTTESWYLGDIMCKVVPFLQRQFDVTRNPIKLPGIQSLRDQNVPNLRFPSG
ncbi:OX1R-like protein [Mya arenaria]|uniref:OX1R-like protein n=1 Tax=Mya arenaria TaxID=6604 RepID=A0ABY7FNX6_MYAAR|nr:OX1R-like protein [Mya arenaria]